MTSVNVIEMISKNTDFITGFWVGVPFGTALGFSLFCCIDDLVSFVYKKIAKLKER